MKKFDKLFVGRTAEGDRVFVTIELRERGSERPSETTEHKQVTTYTELSITGTVVAYRGRSVVAAGQIRDDVAAVVDFEGSAFDEAAVGALLILWNRWHLNGMQAGCAHMDLPADTSYDARQGITCPQTGYVYGTKWLVEDLPDEIVGVVEGFLALDSGNVPNYA